MVQSGEDILVITKACSDSIPALEDFKSFCVPIFLVIAAGNLVDFVHGANGKIMKEESELFGVSLSSTFQQVIKTQVQKELSLKDSSQRASISLEEALPATDYNEDEDEEIREAKSKQNLKNLKMTVMNKNKFN